VACDIKAIDIVLARYGVDDDDWLILAAKLKHMVGVYLQAVKDRHEREAKARQLQDKGAA